MPGQKRYSRYLLLIIMLVGFFLRIHYLNRAIRFDEALAVVAYASRDVASITADYSLPNNHILQTLMTHVMYHLMGIQPLLIRFPVFLIGVLVIPLSYSLSKQVYKQEYIALIAAGLVATSPPLIDFSVNARGYILLTAITLILLRLGHDLKTNDHTGHWLLFAVFSALGFYTIPVMVFPMGVVALWLLVSIFVENRGEERLKLLGHYIISIVLAATLTVILYVPAILFTGLDRLLANDTLTPLPPSVFYTQLPHILAEVVRYIYWEWPFALAAVLSLCAIVGTVYHKRQSNDRVPLLLPAAIWIIAVVILKRSILFERTWLFLVPIMLIIAAAGFVELVLRSYPQKNNPPSKQIVPAGLLLLVFGLSVYLLQSQAILQSVVTGRADDAENAVEFLKANFNKRDIFLASWPSNFTAFYYAQLNDFDLQGDISSGDVTDVQPDATQSGFVYIYYHTEDELSRIADSLGEIIYEAEVFHTFANSTLLRMPLGRFED